MEAKLIIEPTKVSPLVYLHPGEGKYEISGRAISSNAASFFAPVLDWVNQHLKAHTIELSLRMDYFNTSSHKYMLNIIKDLHTLNPENKIRWIFDQDDDEMLDMGKKLQMLTGATFTFEER